MIFFTAAVQLIFPTTDDSLPTADALQAVASNRRWKREARAGHVIFMMPKTLKLDSRRLAQLTLEVDEARSGGLEVVLSCESGPTLETLRKVHFHRFVDILPTRCSARRWAQTARTTPATRSRTLAA